MHVCIHVHVYCMHGVWNQYFCFSLSIPAVHWHTGTCTNTPLPPTHTCTHSLSLSYIFTCVHTHTRDAVRFCFGPMLQKELDEFREDWNNHRIRKSTMAETLGGIPEFLYFAPTHCGQLLQFCTHYYASILNLYVWICAGAEDYICRVDRDLLEFAELRYAKPPESVCVEFQTFAKQVMQSYQLQGPSTWKDALHLFMTLTEEYTNS